MAPQPRRYDADRARWLVQNHTRPILLHATSATTRPLLVIAHPDLMIHAYAEWHSQSESQSKCSPEALSAAMVREIEGWEGDRILIADSFMGEVDPGSGDPLARILGEVWEKDSVILARSRLSDLRDAAKIIVNRFEAAKSPRIVVTGGWANGRNGSVTQLANFLREFGCNSVSISPLAPYRE